MFSTRSELNTIAAIENVTEIEYVQARCPESRKTGVDIASRFDTQTITGVCVRWADPKTTPYLKAGVRQSTVPIFGAAVYWYHLLRQRARLYHRTLTKASTLFTSNSIPV